MKFTEYNFLKITLNKVQTYLLPINLKTKVSKDCTYLLEKLNLQKSTKLVLEKFNSIKIQENIFYKYIIFLKIKFCYSMYLHKYNTLVNLHKYILYNFPIFIFNLNITNNINLRETHIQLNYLKNNKTNYYNLGKAHVPTLNSLKIIESIFELYFFQANATTISPTNGLILNLNNLNIHLYCIEIPLQNLTHNVGITLLSIYSEQNITHIKTLNTLTLGGDVLNLDNFAPNIITIAYYNTLTYTTTMYLSLKNTSLYVYNLILETLIKQYHFQGIVLPSFLFELIVKRMTYYVKILNSGNTCLTYKDIIPSTVINLINQSFTLHGLVGAFYSPTVIGISKLSLSCSGVLSSLSFQETLKSLSTLILTNQIDWILDLKARIIMSDLLDTGTGWYKHYNVIT